MKQIPPGERFWTKVRKSDGCWEWTAARRNGYGAFGWAAGDVRMAHRAAWELVNGPVPDGLVVCHTCDNRACVRPDHLFLGTQADNLADAAAKRRTARGERHGRAKLTAADVLAMREMYATGRFALSEIASRFGVAGSTVSLNVRGLKWQDVGGPLTSGMAYWAEHNERSTDRRGRFTK